MSWPETKIEKLTKEQYDEIANGAISMSATEVCEVMVKIKIVTRCLQIDKVIDANMAEVSDVMVNGFIDNLQAQYKSDEMINVDEFFAKLLAYTIKSTMTPGAIIKLGRAAGGIH